MYLFVRSQAAKVERLASTRENQLRLLALLIVVAIIIAAWFFRGNISALKNLGYPGVFALSLLGSASIFVPLPGIASLCAVSVVLNPAGAALLAAIGETIGELSGYALGYSGRTVFQKQRLYNKMRFWMERRGTIILFLVSVIPNPIFDVVGVAAGGLRYPVPRFMAVVWVGKSLKSLAVAYSCAFAIDPVIRIFNNIL